MPGVENVVRFLRFGVNRDLRAVCEWSFGWEAGSTWGFDKLSLTPKGGADPCCCGEYKKLLPYTVPQQNTRQKQTQTVQ